MVINKKKYKFKMLQKAKNFKQQNKNIMFALQEVKLQEHILKTTMRPSKLKSYLNNNED